MHFFCVPFGLPVFSFMAMAAQLAINLP